MAGMDPANGAGGGKCLKDAIEEQVARIAADVFGVDIKTLDGDSGPERIEAWDSVNHLNLVLAIEAQYSLEFDPDESDKFTTLGRIAERVRTRLEGPAAR